MSRLLIAGWEFWLAQIDGAGLRLFAEESLLVDWVVMEADERSCR